MAICLYLQEMGRSWEMIQADPDDEPGTETETEDEE